MRSPRLLWVDRPSNRKTGPIPTASVGATRQETWDSCDGCPLRDGGECYAWYGTPRMGMAAMHKAYERNGGASHDIGAIYRPRRHPDAKAIRLGAIGDPARADRGELRHAIGSARDEGLAVIGYTHHWRLSVAKGLAADLMASCDDMRDADTALAAGWRPAAVVAPGTSTPTVRTPGGATLLVCPGTKERGERMTCNDCRMCDPSHRVWSTGRIQGIAFPAHGSGKSKSAKRLGRRLEVV